MPFVSQAQRAFMFQHHPDIARRWEAVTPKDQTLPNHTSPDSTSEETNKLGVRRLPRPPGGKRDFGGLSPSSVSRHKESKPSSEKESMGESPVEAHTRGEAGKMGLKYKDESRLQGRDIRNAERRR